MVQIKIEPDRFLPTLMNGKNGQNSRQTSILDIIMSYGRGMVW